MISRPGHPDDVVSVKDVVGTKVDSGFIGSCTNGRMDDMRAVARVLKDKKIAPGRVLKIVPSTDKIWSLHLDHYCQCRLRSLYLSHMPVVKDRLALEEDHSIFSFQVS